MGLLNAVVTLLSFVGILWSLSGSFAFSVNGSDYTTGINLSGVYPNDVEINKRTMICGRFINELDLKERRKSIVISSDMAKELLPQSPLSLNGQIIRTTTLAFRVVEIGRAHV